jgi:aldehyde dehydrogenase (NAD(P)+)
MQKMINDKNLSDNMASFYKQKHPAGKVSLVLGAGNINSIPALDLLYNLIVKGEVVFLKMNPINAYLTPVFKQIFKPLINRGYLRIIAGGADVGQYLTAHNAIESIHITGSEKTHDLIVYGSGAKGKERKKKDKPILDASKSITSELGGISPMIVVPGPWTEADILFHAKNIVSAKLHNGGHNCVASQVLILPKSWDKSKELLNKVQELMNSVDYRPAYYPGIETRHKALLKAYPNAKKLVGDIPRIFVKNLNSATDEYAFSNEFFGAMYAQTDIKGVTPLAYFKNAVKFCNDKLHGTLGATILIHPKTQKEMGIEFENCIADLKYGAIGINVWNGVLFLLAQSTWGAYPGHTYKDIQSGIGIVHNSLMLDHAEKSVLQGYFRPFPRAFNLAPPSPPWFVTNKTAAKTMKKITRFAIKPNLFKIPGIVLSAFGV